MVVYVSLTSIFDKQDSLLQTLQSLISQTLQPDKIYLYLSEEPYILDKGFKYRNISHIPLKQFLESTPLIEVHFVENTGPYRKLLPLLKHTWGKNCMIITVDDDVVYHPDLIKTLVMDYTVHKECVGLRGFTPHTTDLSNFSYHQRIPTQETSVYNFLTGIGSALYTWDMFKGLEHILFDKEIYMMHCRTADDIWFYILRILNNRTCRVLSSPFMLKDLFNPAVALSSNINWIDDKNTTYVRSVYAHINSLLDNS